MSTDLFNSDLSNRFVCTVDAPFYDHDNPYTIRLLLTLQDLWTIPYESIKTEHFWKKKSKMNRQTESLKNRSPNWIDNTVSLKTGWICQSQFEMNPWTRFCGLFISISTKDLWGFVGFVKSFENWLDLWSTIRVVWKQVGFVNHDLKRIHGLGFVVYS